MSKNSPDVPCFALTRALIGCRDHAVALAARVLNFGLNQCGRQQPRRRLIARAAAAHAESSDERALEVWDDDGGHSRTSDGDERYTRKQLGGVRALAKAIFSMLAPRARHPSVYRRFAVRSGRHSLANALPSSGDDHISVRNDEFA